MDDELIILAEFLVSEWEWIKGKLRLDDIPTHAVNNSDTIFLNNSNQFIHDQTWSVNNTKDNHYVYSTDNC